MRRVFGSKFAIKSIHRVETANREDLHNLNAGEAFALSCPDSSEYTDVELKDGLDYYDRTWVQPNMEATNRFSWKINVKF